MVVGHIDGNGMSSCWANLRICTPEQNRPNTRPRQKPSGSIVACRRDDKGGVKIKHKGISHDPGQFDDEIEATKAHDRKAIDLWANTPG